MSVERFLQSHVTEIRFALRRLRKTPGYTLSSILMLGLGLGATAAMLAILDSVLLLPVALPHPEQMVAIELSHGTGTQQLLPFKDIQVLEREVPNLQAVAGYTSLPEPITTGSGTRVTATLHVTTNFLSMVGVPPRLGRVFTTADKDAPVAVVNDAFWRDNLHADPHVIGSLIHADGRVVTVIGIMPPGFTFPPESFSGPIVCMPLALDSKGKDSHGFEDLGVLARVRPGISRMAAQSQAQAVYARTGSAAKDGWRLVLHSYSAMLTGDEQPALFALLGACALLLGIACVNSANLQIARGTGRLGEMRVRAALGASRMRLLQQIAVESVTLSLLGAALGMLLAYAAVHWIRLAYGERFPRFGELALHPIVFAGCALLAIVVGLLAALAPGLAAVHGARESFAIQTARTTSGSRLSGILVMAEVALTCVLLATAGLFLRTFGALERVPLGFDPHHVTEITLMPLNPKESGDVLKQTYENLLQRLRVLPGVAAAATQTSLPFSNFTLSLNSTFRISGRPQNDKDKAYLSLISQDFPQTMGISMLDGRGFQSSDSSGATLVCIVNQAFVRQFLHGARVLGRSLEFTSDDKNGPDDTFLPGDLTVVGIMPDQVAGQTMEPAVPTVYLDYLQFPASSEFTHLVFGIAPQFAVRSSLPQNTLDHEIRAALKQGAPDMAEMGLGSMDENMSNSLNNRRLALRLSSGFGLSALLLAAIGIYGVLAFTVVQRTREIGVRMALGSTRGGVVRLIVRQAGVMAVSGLAVGLLASWPAGRAVRSFLFGVQPVDPLTLLSTAALLLLACAAAAAGPTWQAAQVDPAEALRAE